MNKETVMSKHKTQTTGIVVGEPKKTTTLSNLPVLPTDVKTSDWYIDSINNSKLTNVGGE